MIPLPTVTLTQARQVILINVRTEVYDRVVLMNESLDILDVYSGANQVRLQPQTSDVLELSSLSLIIVPILSGAAQVAEQLQLQVMAVSKDEQLESYPQNLTNPASASNSTQYAAFRGGTGAGITITLNAPGAGIFHYIFKVKITKFAAAALVADATGSTTTSTNLNNLQWLMGTDALALGGIEEETDDFQPPVKSAVANTATTITTQAKTNVVWQVGVNFYTGP
jgi:hypothetical protein